jgi:3-carboxy-cis,cis-muconate cycloisomerase
VSVEEGFARTFSTERMSSVFSRASRVEAILRFEAALARAEARAGLIPSEAAEAIEDRCRLQLFDVASLQREGRLSGTLAIPLVRRLTDLVPESARGFVHWGATSQDAMDTGMVLQVRAGLEALVEDLLGVGSACASLAERHAGTLMPGRTLLQHAVPITFGLKAAHWLATTTRRLASLLELDRDLPVQLGGAAGTLASLGTEGPRVVELLAEDLGLAVPDLPWHTDRDRIAEIAGALGVAAGAMAKIAGDVSLLMQTEVGEVAEGREEGQGTSSAMPQKRNPVHAPAAVASAQLAFGAVSVILGAAVHEHERAVGGWQAEWEAVPDLFHATASAVWEARRVVEDLAVDDERMSANLALTRGQIMAESLVTSLARHLGRHEAHRIVREACERATREAIDLVVAAAEDPRIVAVLSDDAIRTALDSSGYLGSAETFIVRAVARFREVADGARRPS